MQLPFTFVFEPPTRADVRAALRDPRVWAQVIALCLLAGAVIASVRLYQSSTAVVADAVLQVSSDPAGATILIDDRERGRTPATLALLRGPHRITLRLARHADISYDVALAPERPATVDGRLWQQMPAVRRLRSPLPGATIADVRFLADGRLALILALPGSDERQLWLVDRGGDARPIGPTGARLALAVAHDGARVAYLARGGVPVGGAPPADVTGAPRLDEVWLAGLDGGRGERRYALPPNTADERLVDLSWSPDGGHLLLVGQQRPQGGTLRTRLLRLDAATGATRELIALPGEVVPGSYAWSPAGDRVALLVRAGNRTALCLLGTADGAFRSLADAGAAPFPALAWSPRGDRLAYAAPPDTAPGDVIGAAVPALLHTDDLDGGPARRLGDATGQGPGWRGDGLIVAIDRPKGRGPLLLRAYDAAGHGQDLGQLPLPTGALAGVHWDLPRGRALVATRPTAGGDPPDLWLVRWAASDEEVVR